MMEGLGKIHHVARLRLVQSVVGYFALWCALSMGYGLSAMPLLAASQAVISGVWLIKQRGLKPESQRFQETTISWKREIFPFQWKIAVSWLSGYLIFQLFTPAIFAAEGAEAAGQVGLALSLFTTLLTLPMSWVTAKNPEMARLIGQRQLAYARQLFWNVYIRSAILCLVAVLSLISLIKIAQMGDFQIANRLPSMYIIILLGIVTQVNHFIFTAATFMRSFKEEPMLLNSLVVAILVTSAVFFLGKRGSLALILSYTAVVAFVSLPWCVCNLKNYLNRK